MIVVMFMIVSSHGRAEPKKRAETQKKGQQFLRQNNRRMYRAPRHILDGNLMRLQLQRVVAKISSQLGFFRKIGTTASPCRFAPNWCIG